MSNPNPSSGNSSNNGNSSDYGPRRRIRERRPSRVYNFPPGECICNRPTALVVCNVCNFAEPGRVRYPCPVHHQVIFITDTIECSKCKADYDALSEV